MASMCTYGLIVLVCVFFVHIQCTDLQVGTSINSELIFTETVQASSIPMKVRTKSVFYTNSTNPRVIKGITAIDMGRSEAQASITAGGVGATFANVRLKSARGDGLNYQIQIFG